MQKEKEDIIMVEIKSLVKEQKAEASLLSVGLDRNRSYLCVTPKERKEQVRKR